MSAFILSARSLFLGARHWADVVCESTDEDDEQFERNRRRPAVPPGLLLAAETKVKQAVTWAPGARCSPRRCGRAARPACRPGSSAGRPGAAPATPRARVADQVGRAPVPAEVVEIPVTGHASHVTQSDQDKTRQTWIPAAKASLTLSYLARVSVDRGSPTPAYLQLAEILRSRIAVGDWQHGPLPSNRALRETYEVGEFVVTRALQELEEEGLVFTVPGGASTSGGSDPARHDPARARHR